MAQYNQNGSYNKLHKEFGPGVYARKVILQAHCK